MEVIRYINTKSFVPPKDKDMALMWLISFPIGPVAQIIILHGVIAGFGRDVSTAAWFSVRRGYSGRLAHVTYFSFQPRRHIETQIRCKFAQVPLWYTYFLIQPDI